MEKKKRSQLETKRKVYFSLGLFIVSTGVLCAFTYRTPIYVNKDNLAINQEANVPLMLVEESVEKQKPVLPKVEKLPNPKPSTPIFNPELLTKITPIGNKNTTPPNTISTKTEITDTFIPETGLPPELTKVVKYPDREAIFPGNWPEFLEDNTHYPEESISSQETGKVFVGFIVEKDGTLSNIRVLNKDEVAFALQEEALRVVKSSPNWKPGINNGEKVRTNMVVKINFILGG